MYADSISKNTTSNVTHTYRLYMWIGNEVVIGVGDNVDYDMETWNNDVYASIKVNVTGDFTEKSLIETITEGCYTIEANTLTQKATITNYNCSGTTANIPSTISGYTVTATGDSSFDTGQLNSVTIPNSVITIGRSAFINNSITSITIPDSVVTIGDSAFASCWAISGNLLTTLTIPDSVITIGDSAFADNKLTSVTLGNNVETIGNNAFSEDSSGVFHSIDGETGEHIGNQITSITIPNSVTYLGESAFAYNALTSVTIGNGITEIPSEAFYDNLITNITFGSNAETIGDYAFCKNRLTSLTIPNSMKTIGYYAFDGNNLTNVILGSGLELIEDESFSAEALVPIGSDGISSGSDRSYGPNNISSVFVPKGLTDRIGDCAEYNVIGVTAFDYSAEIVYEDSTYNYCSWN